MLVFEADILVAQLREMVFLSLDEIFIQSTRLQLEDLHLQALGDFVHSKILKDRKSKEVEVEEKLLELPRPGLTTH